MDPPGKAAGTAASTAPVEAVEGGSRGPVSENTALKDNIGLGTECQILMFMCFLGPSKKHVSNTVSGFQCFSGSVFTADSKRSEHENRLRHAPLTPLSEALWFGRRSCSNFLASTVVVSRLGFLILRDSCMHDPS